MSGGRRGLVIGFGNPGRGDDGLGPRLVEAFEERRGQGAAGCDVEAVFQLSLEHAAEVADRRWVVFVDAAAEGGEPFAVSELAPEPAGSAGEARLGAGFSTHDMGPEAVLALAESSFGRRPPAWLLAIRGYRFGLAEHLSRRATANLRAALAWLESKVAALERGGEA